jgi:translation initiation factor RLI1
VDFFLICWEKFGLDKKEDRLLSSLSGGEGQALKICLGLAPKTEIYSLDEPSQYLDDGMKMVLGHVIQELLLRKKSIFMVEHDLNWQKFSLKVVQLEINNRNLMRGKEWIT